MQQLGNTKQASTLLYLPTPPTVDAMKPLDYASLCELNGNHWRKILIILAKLQCPDEDWRSYRDQQLLRQREAIIFGDQLLPGKQLHIVAGKASWERVGLDPEQFLPLEESNRLLQQGNIILTPYPDYRQFPNHLIERLRPIIHASR
ncbi:hypothetical protein [Amphritea sp.]|uniref:DUF6942 family protein n=1 Tax=Amphritea sp. TaxID=1872502 RepID=UPI0025C1F2CE|nr:hypothetical protein [Amphritea sp.]